MAVIVPQPLPNSGRPPRPNAPAVSVSGLTVVRGGFPAVSDVSFDIAAGSVTGLLGPSGCGKTTVMRCLMGVQIVTAGTVTVLGMPAGTAALRSRVGYVTQSPAIYTDLSVGENLRYFGSLLGVPVSEGVRVAGAVDLGDRVHDVVGRLSGGERARVSLATALLGTPELLVLDEPTVGLDPVLRRDLWGLFRRLADDGVTLLVSSHVMDEAARCDRLLLMRAGHILADDSPTELLARTGARDVEEAFLTIVEQSVPG